MDTVRTAAAEGEQGELTLPRLQFGSDLLGVFMAGPDPENALPGSGPQGVSAKFWPDLHTWRWSKESYSGSGQVWDPKEADDT